MKNNINSFEIVEAPSKKQLLNNVQAEFKKQFDNQPKHVTITPGRVNIIGEHTDYNDGLAMPTAIDRWICAAACKSSNESFNIYSLDYNESVTISFHTPNKFKGIWKQLAAEALHVITTEFTIKEGINMVVGGNIPIGCGLSSSSAFVISITQTFCRLFSIKMEDRQLARLCQKIENRTLGTAAGFLDQYGIILSKKNHFMVIDFQANTIGYIPVSLKNGCSWIVINSQVPRELSKSAYLQRVNECKEGLEILKGKFNISTFRDIDNSMLDGLKNESNVLYKRLCHVVNENQRVRDMKDQLQQGTAQKVGKILKESHKSLKSLYEVSCEEIDYIIKLSMDFDGWYGGRIIGGGFGGCSIHLVVDEGVKNFNDYITTNYTKRFGIIPEIINVTFPGGLQYV